MRRVAIALFAVSLIAAPSFAAKVEIDYAERFDFQSVDTFLYVATWEAQVSNTLMAERIASMIQRELRAAGLSQLEQEKGLFAKKVKPDIYVTYHFVSEDEGMPPTSGLGYGGYQAGWTDAGGRPSGHTKGTLVIDAFDSKEKKLVWRGTGTVTVKADPEKQIKQVDEILTKLGKKWDKILKGMRP